VFRFITIIMFVLMLMAVAVQYNDPDGWLWMLIYGYAVAVTWMALRKKYTYFSVVGVVGYLGGFFYLMPESFDGWYTNEIAREALGLLITAIWMVVLSAKLYRNLPDDETAEAQSPDAP